MTPEEETIEREANAFAMELLVPTAFLVAELMKLGYFDLEDDAALEKLAKKFKVSVQVLTLRVGQVMTRI